MTNSTRPAPAMLHGWYPWDSSTSSVGAEPRLFGLAIDWGLEVAARDAPPAADRHAARARRDYAEADRLLVEIEQRA